MAGIAFNLILIRVGQGRHNSRHGRSDLQSIEFALETSGSSANTVDTVQAEQTKVGIICYTFLEFEANYSRPTGTNPDSLAAIPDKDWRHSRSGAGEWWECVGKGMQKKNNTMHVRTVVKET